MESGVSAEVNFAQKLASNEKKIRDRAIKRLSRYLSVRSKHENGLSESDLLKIWKGLFYCMWMQDKPLIQEELSQRITNLVHCFPKTEDALRFVKVFLETQSREWIGIDRLRLDKFLMMVRDMVRQTFTLLSKDDWKESDCRTFALSVYEHAMSAHEPRLPDGLKLHLADIFVEEMRKVPVEKLTGKTMLILLQPFIEFILFTNKIELARRVISEVIYKVLKAISTKHQVVQEETDATDDTNQMDEDMEVDFTLQKVENKRRFNLDRALLLKLLFDMAGRKVVRASNRALIYKLVRKQSKAFGDSANSLSSPEQTSDVQLTEDEKQEEQDFVCDLRFLKDGGKAVDQNQGKKRRRRRRKKEEKDDTTETVDVETVADGDDVSTPKADKQNRKSGNEENASCVAHNNSKERKLIAESLDSKLGDVNRNNIVYTKLNGKILNSTHTQLVVSQTPVLGDTKDSSKNNNNKHFSGSNNSGDVCNNSSDVTNRKRKFASDESGILPSAKKKSKLNSADSSTELLDGLQNQQYNVGKSAKKKKKTGQFESKLVVKGKLNVDRSQSEEDTNCNARPKYRSTNLPKSVPATCPVEFVKYSPKAPVSLLAELDLTKGNRETVSPPSNMTKFAVSNAALDSSEHDDMNLCEGASVQSDNSSRGGSARGSKKSLLGLKIRSKSESPKKIKDSSASSSGIVKTVLSALSASCNSSKVTCSIDTEKGTPSGVALGSKKKVIFDLRKNKANKFQDYLKSIASQPDSPFEPTKSPVAGILKSPSPSDSECTSTIPASKKSLSYGRRTSAPCSLVRTPGRKQKKSFFMKSGHS